MYTYLIVCALETISVIDDLVPITHIHASGKSFLHAICSCISVDMLKKKITYV